MEPVAGAVDADYLRMAKMPGPAIFGRIARPALLAVHQERRAIDPRPEKQDVTTPHVVGRPGTHVVVELPAVRPVLVLVDAVHGQVPGLLGREVRVLLLHAPEGVLDGGVATGESAGEVALLGDPFLHALDDRRRGGPYEPCRWRAEPPDGDETGDRAGIDAGVAEGDLTAQRVGDDRDRRQALLMDELGQVVDVAGQGVAAVGRPLAVAVPPEIGRENVPVVPPRRGGPVPVPAG